MGAAVVGAAVVDAAVVGAAVVGAAVVDAAVVDAAVVGAVARGALMSMKHSNDANGSSQHRSPSAPTLARPKVASYPPTPLLPAEGEGAAGSERAGSHSGMMTSKRMSP